MTAEFDASVADRERGLALLQLGRHEQALEFLGRAAGSGDMSALLPLGYCFNQLCRFEEALNYADQGIAADPHNDFGFNVRATALIGLNRLTEARDAADVALSLNPNDADNYMILADVLDASKKYKEALKAMQTAVALSPQSSATHINLSHAALAARKSKIATEHARIALQLDPTNASALNNLGVALMRRQRYLSAQQMFHAALAADPSLDVAKHNSKRILMGYLGPLWIITFLGLRHLGAIGWVIGFTAMIVGGAVLTNRMPAPLRRAAVRTLLDHWGTNALCIASVIGILVSMFGIFSGMMPLVAIALFVVSLTTCLWSGRRIKRR